MNEQFLRNASVKDAFVSMRDSQTITNNDISKSQGHSIQDADANLFLANALEKVDPYLHKPLARFFYQEAMPIMYGGGAIEYASFFRVNYNAYDSNKNAASGNSNIITNVLASIDKTQTLVKPYAWSIAIGWIDEMKYRQVGSSILQQVEDGVRLYYNQKLDEVAFYGFVNEGNSQSYGLINNPNITSILSTVDFSDTDTDPRDIVDELNTALAAIVANTSYSRQYVTNHIALPPSVYSALVKPMVVGSADTGIYTNIMEYFKANNYIKAFFGDDDIMIVPISYLETAGAAKNNVASRRIVLYCYNEACIRMPLPMDLTRGTSMFDPSAMDTKIPFVTFIGSPQFVYQKTMIYLDQV